MPHILLTENDASIVLGLCYSPEQRRALPLNQKNSLRPAEPPQNVRTAQKRDPWCRNIRF